MKNLMRIVVFSVGSALLPSLVLAQAGSSMPGQQPGGAPTQPGASGSNMPGGMGTASGGFDTQEQQMKDRSFVHNAAEGGMAEVQFGQLASQKASNPQVKQFAQKMVSDHSALNAQMAPIAQSMGVSLPKKLNKKDAEEYSKLQGLNGSDFDKEYVSAMVKDHHKDLKEFNAEASVAADPNLKAAVTKGAQVIYQHTEMIDQIAQAQGIEVPHDKIAPPAAQQ